MTALLTILRQTYIIGLFAVLFPTVSLLTYMYVDNHYNAGAAATNLRTSYKEWYGVNLNKVFCSRSETEDVPNYSSCLARTPYRGAKSFLCTGILDGPARCMMVVSPDKIPDDCNRIDCYIYVGRT